MRAFQIVLAVALVCVCNAAPHPDKDDNVLDYYAHPAYVLDYSVNDPHTGDYKNQWEIRDGDVVKGGYQFLDADGTIRRVEYRADDKTGFSSVASRIGVARHPQTYPKIFDLNKN